MLVSTPFRQSPCLKAIPRRHPQDFVIPLTRLLPSTWVCRPHSQAHKHTGHPRLVETALRTVRRPNRFPVRSTLLTSLKSVCFAHPHDLTYPERRGPAFASIFPPQSHSHNQNLPFGLFTIWSAVNFPNLCPVKSNAFNLILRLYD